MTTTGQMDGSGAVSSTEKSPASRAGETPALRYRRDIDGLRAVAVLAVIGYHARWPGFAGGFLGVDVFFVISGYLITRLIMAEAAAGRFALGHFFARRFRRLAPALTVVLLACLAPAWWWMLPGSLMDFGRALFAVLLLVPNLHFWRSTGYFQAATDAHPLLHTWSLGIEEQFYLVYALLMLLLLARARRQATAWLALLFISSLVGCELLRREAAVATFYLLPFRAWEMLLGALAARLAGWLDGRAGAAEAGQGRDTVRTAGAIGLVACLLAFDDSVLHPGLWTLVPTVLTAMVLIGDSRSGLAARLLCWRPLVGIGLVSYSAYLWHHPLFAFTELALLRAPSGWESLVLVGLTLALAGLSWRLVEQPARQPGRPLWQVVGGVGAGALTVAAFAAWVLAHAGAPERLPPSARALLEAGESRNPRQAECMTRTDHPRPPSQACRLGDPSAPPTLVLMGDSHADALFVALDERLSASGRAGLFMAHNGCAPTPSLRRSDMGRKSPCEGYFSAAYAWLAAHPELTTVVLAARWSVYLDEQRFDNTEGGRDNGPRLQLDALAGAADRSSPSSESTRAERVLRGYSDGIEQLRAMGRQVVLVDPIPEVGRHVPHWLALQQMRGMAAGTDYSTPLAAYRLRHQAVLGLFDTLPTGGLGGSLQRVRTVPLFCAGPAPDRCVAQAAGQPLYYDDNHLNRVGAQRVVEAITAALAVPPAY